MGAASPLAAAARTDCHGDTAADRFAHARANGDAQTIAYTYGYAGPAHQHAHQCAGADTDPGAYSDSANPHGTGGFCGGDGH